MITQWHGNILRWILAAGAFLAVLAAAGCTGGNSSPAANTPPQATNLAPPADPAVMRAAADDAKPAAVNVFGEFDGVERAPAKAHGNGGFQQHTFLDEGYDSDISVDPTGKWMVFTSTRDSVHPNIYLQRVDGLSVIQLTNDEADYAFPVFSADGKQIAVSSNRAGNWDIYVMDTDGKNVVQLTNDSLQHVHPSFSPDGGRVVYSAMGGKSGQWELWVIDLSTSEKRMIGFGLFPSWCPTRGVDRIAFQRARQRGSRWFSLWTLDLVDGEARRVTELAESSNAAIVAPSWSPDGKQLAFATIAEPGNSTASRPLGQQDIWTIDADGGNRRRVTDGIGLNLQPWWGTSNRIFFISDRGGAECVWSAHSDGDTGAAPTASKDKTPAGTAVGSTN